MCGGPLNILVCQCTGHREHDVASRITVGEGCPKALVMWAVMPLSHVLG
jgi:hypothetical protein